MPNAERSFDFALDRIETRKGKADFCNLRKVSERGHEISRLPYSIKILLENAIRHSKSVEGASEAANRLLEWPRSVGSEFPFMPYRVPLAGLHGRASHSRPGRDAGRDGEQRKWTRPRSTR